jgi:protein-tyrosine phosphatase
MVKTGIEKPEKIKVLILCIGNLCRSPFAERLLRTRIPSNKLDAEVFSRGTMAQRGETPTKEAIEAAKKWSINLSDHRSHPLDLCDINTSDLILTMDSTTAETLNDLYELWDIAIPLGRFYPDYFIPDIEDPYGKGVEEYIKCYEMIEKCVDGFIKFYTE